MSEDSFAGFPRPETMATGGGSQTTEDNNNEMTQAELFNKLQATINNRYDLLEARLNQLDAQAGAANHPLSESEEEEEEEEMNPLRELLEEAVSGNSSPKQAKEKDVEGDALLEELLKQAEASSLTDEEVDARVATIINAVFRKKMEKDQHKELTSNIGSARPKNCEGLVAVQTNPLLWGNFSEKTKINDKKPQSQQKTLMSASAILTKIFNSFVNAKGDSTKLKLSELMSKMHNALTLLGDVNFHLNMFRRHLMKPELKDQYKRLCAETIPFTSELFGQDLPKLAKEIGETAKIGNQLKLVNKFKKTEYKKNRYEPYARSSAYKKDRPRSSYANTYAGSYAKGKNFPKATGEKPRR